MFFDGGLTSVGCFWVSVFCFGECRVAELRDGSESASNAHLFRLILQGIPSARLQLSAGGRNVVVNVVER